MKKLNLAMIIIWSAFGLLILAAMVWGIIFRDSDIMGMDMGNFDKENSLLINETVSVKDLDNIKLILAADECIVYLTDGSDVNVKHYGRSIPERNYVSVKQEADTLRISTMEQGLGISFGNWSRRSIVEVYLPKSYRENLDINIMSGTLDFKDELDLSGLDIDISSGGIRADNEIKAKSASIDLTSGTVKLNGGLVTDEYSAKIGSGTISVRERLTGSGKINVTSGSVNLSGVDIAEFLTIEVNSGTVKAEIAGDPALNFTGKKTSGTINTYFDASKSDGSVTAVVGEAPYKDLSVKVTSGTVSITQAK